ncbi:hypothetical protein MTP99_006056 [Tenebrio molitor]|nr:hypothetical protein MTP99_006056 [Tenebrio molitor]
MADIIKIIPTQSELAARNYPKGDSGRNSSESGIALVEFRDFGKVSWVSRVAHQLSKLSNPSKRSDILTKLDMD